MLIANRGEIAVRIIRTCREMGIETVVTYSTADKESLPVLMADRSVCIGPPPSSLSYLNKENIIMAAFRENCDAIHPGVGFLSENAGFAQLVQARGLLFIGPSPELLELLGDKVMARKTAQKYSLPVTPGTPDAVSTLDSAKEAATELGFPVIIKAAAGGGGKGMRVAYSLEELEENYALASAEAKAAFADGRVYIERYLENPRHIELQILSDGKGRAAVLGERDCSVQKNHQKLIEESPSPVVTQEMRSRMSQAASRMFSELNYTGAGTIEFLVEGDNFYFMEVNARLQVEHPVTEFTTGYDIVRQQILACSESRLDLESDEVPLAGWAIECRINALAPGTVTRLDIPGGPGVRFDSFLYEGCFVPPHYDSMVGKLIVHGRDREHALTRMDRALWELNIQGLRTNQHEQRWIIRDHTFRSGAAGTSYYESIVERMNAGN